MDQRSDLGGDVELMVIGLQSIQRLVVPVKRICPQSWELVIGVGTEADMGLGLVNQKGWMEIMVDSMGWSCWWEGVEEY